MTHASAIFVTTDDVCAALLAFVGSLSNVSHSESVTIPALRVDGEVMDVRMTVSAHSTFVVVPVDADADDESTLAAASASTVNELQARSASNS